MPHNEQQQQHVLVKEGEEGSEEVMTTQFGLEEDLANGSAAVVETLRIKLAHAVHPTYHVFDSEGVLGFTAHPSRGASQLYDDTGRPMVSIHPRELRSHQTLSLDLDYFATHLKYTNLVIANDGGETPASSSPLASGVTLKLCDSAFVTKQLTWTRTRFLHPTWRLVDTATRQPLAEFRAKSKFKKSGQLLLLHSFDVTDRAIILLTLIHLLNRQPLPTPALVASLVVGGLAGFNFHYVGSPINYTPGILPGSTLFGPTQL